MFAGNDAAFCGPRPDECIGLKAEFENAQGERLPISRLIVISLTLLLTKHFIRIYDRAQFDCDSCCYQFSVLAGTIFQDTKLPLATWFAVTYLMCESKKGISAAQIKRMIGGSYETSWYLCHRIRAAMKEVNPQPLSGTVEMAETYVGGRRRGILDAEPIRKSSLESSSAVENFASSTPRIASPAHLRSTSAIT